MRVPSLHGFLPIGLLAVLGLLLPTAMAGSPQAACLPGLAAYANDDGSIPLSWPGVANATGYQVVEQPQGGDSFPVTPQVPPSATTLTVTPTVQADSYQFTVVALVQGTHPLPYCTATVARIPFFPTWVASVMGLGGALAGVSFLLSRRRA